MPLSDSVRSAATPVPVMGAPIEVSLIEAIAGWCECLQGRLPLVTSLKHLAEGLDARAVSLSRHAREPGGPVKVVVYNAPALGRPSPEVTRSFAHCVLGRYVDRPRPASVWFSSLAESQDDPALAVFQGRARIAETVVVTLALEDKWVDYLEFHFAHTPSIGAQGLFNTLADTLSRTWARRSPGLFSDAILASQPQSSPRFTEPLLSTANPARLSRAEFRICVLLSRGLNTAAVCSELTISPSTMRSHLRSIFAKTGTTSTVELLYLLLTTWKNDAGRSGAVAVRRA